MPQSQPEEIPNILLVSRKGTSIPALFSPQHEKTLVKVCTIVHSLDIAIKAMEKTQFSLVVTEDHISWTARGKVVPYLGFSLATFAVVHRVGRMAILVHSPRFTRRSIEDFNLKFKGTEFAYLFTRGQVRDGHGSSIYGALFEKLFEKMPQG